MKRHFKFVLATLALPLLAAAAAPPAHAAPTREIEVPVRRVLFPTQGYDDNDNAQVMIEGDLPDPCYVIGRQEVSRDATGLVTVRQFAWRDREGACDTGDMLGDSPFSEEVSLGRLRAGDYRVAYRPERGAPAFRLLHVEPATVNTTDSLNYARVTALKMPEIVLAGEHAVVELSGPLRSSCNQIRTPIEVRRQNDVFTIRPVELERGDCGWSLRTFAQTLDLGLLEPGEYLVHVRSRQGKAVERTFRVLGHASGG